MRQSLATRFSPRELALASLFGASGLLLPVVFHLVNLGAVFMPMYLPLVTLAFLVRPTVSVSTAVLVPLLSALATGMPPFYPPIVFIMMVELAGMALLVSMLRRTSMDIWLVLVGAILLGRVLNAAASFGAAKLLDLPAGFFTFATFVSSWPGLVLLLAVVPPLVRVFRQSPQARRIHQQEAP